MTTGQAEEEDPAIDPCLQSLALIDRRNGNPHPTTEDDVHPLCPSDLYVDFLHYPRLWTLPATTAERSSH